MPADKKTRERTEGAASAVQAKYGDSCSANRVDPEPTCLDSFGDDSTGPPALPCSRNDAMVGNGAAAPKSCLSPLEMRSPTATGGLLPAGKASTTTRITFYHPRLRFCLKDINSIRLVLQFLVKQSACFPLQVEGYTKKIKSDSGVRSRRLYRSSTHLPVFCERGGRCFVGRFFIGSRMIPEAGWSIFWQMDHLAGEVQANRLRRTYCSQSLFLRSQAGLKMPCRQRRYEAI